MANQKQKNFKKLQQEWYAKLAKDGFEDIEWGGGASSPYLKGNVKPKPESYNSTVTYYTMAAAYLNNYWKLRGKNRFIWKLHADGYTYDEIAQAYKEKYGSSISVWTVYYKIQDIAEDCIAWNQKDED